ncbi:Uncharacterized protein APZ42_003115, partial [Daphnia magna]
RARHGHPPLSRAPEGQGDVDQPDRVDLRLDPRPLLPRQVRRHAGRGEVRRDAGEGLRRHGRGRLHDQGPGTADRAEPALADDQPVPRQARPEPAGRPGLTGSDRRSRGRGGQAWPPLLVSAQTGCDRMKAFRNEPSV